MEEDAVVGTPRPTESSNTAGRSSGRRLFFAPAAYSPNCLELVFSKVGMYRL